MLKPLLVTDLQLTSHDAESDEDDIIALEDNNTDYTSIIPTECEIYEENF